MSDHFRKTTKAQLNYRKCKADEDGCTECRNIVRTLQGVRNAGYCPPIGLERKTANIVRRGYRCDKYQDFETKNDAA